MVEFLMFFPTKASHRPNLPKEDVQLEMQEAQQSNLPSTFPSTVDQDNDNIQVKFYPTPSNPLRMKHHSTQAHHLRLSARAAHVLDMPRPPETLMRTMAKIILIVLL